MNMAGIYSCSLGVSSVIYLTESFVRHILHYIPQTLLRILTKTHSKSERLKTLGALNPHPERVHAPEFQADTFFDPRDLIQVKYGMLRWVHVDGATKAQAAARFGMSRPTFYQADAAFSSAGLAGLLPQARGPKGAHKLTAEVMTLIETHLAEQGPVGARDLARLIETTRGMTVHPRSIERALARKKKRPIRPR